MSIVSYSTYRWATGATHMGRWAYSQNAKWLQIKKLKSHCKSAHAGSVKHDCPACRELTAKASKL